MPESSQHRAPTVLTALLTRGVVRVTHTMRDGVALIEEVLSLEHTTQETSLWVGDVEYHSSGDGPYPNHLMRVSVRPSTGCAALSYTDHDDPTVSIVNSFNPGPELSEVYLIFNGDTGDVFPQSAVITIADARSALLEWLRTRSLPTSINWRPFGQT
jgi:Immunity protein Imm1